jgi:hypothetical protein
MPIEIRSHTPGVDLKDFIQAAHVVFEGDAGWVPPLDFDIKGRLSPKKNPFFQRGEVALFTAWKDGKLVGRTQEWNISRKGVCECLCVCVQVHMCV